MKADKKQQGYTLIELMVAIVLGLLVTAAALQLFVTGQASYRLQRSLASLQDNGSFGMNYLVSDIRKANSGAATALMNDQTAYSGILLTANNVGANLSIDPNYLTKSASALSASNIASLQSDQLTLQYQPSQAGYDCTGAAISAAEVGWQVQIVQRYFVRKDTAGDQGLALACVADRYYKGYDASISAKSLVTAQQNNSVITLNLTGAGQIIIPRVDYFHVLLSTSTGHFDAPTAQTYTAISGYSDCSAVTTATASCYLESWEDAATHLHAASIRGLQIGLLVRATDSAGGNAAVKQRNGPTLSYKVLDKFVTLDTTLASYSNEVTYIRQAMNQTVTFRNAAGEGSK